jgi:hypothetical protein
VASMPVMRSHARGRAESARLRMANGGWFGLWRCLGVLPNKAMKLTRLGKWGDEAR